jgi:hypothetical protein
MATAFSDRPELAALRRAGRFVPVQQRQWLAASIPGAEADSSDRDGHLTLIGRIGEIHDWLLQYSRQTEAFPARQETLAGPGASG